jgi:hypothetical protein
MKHRRLRVVVVIVMVLALIVTPYLLVGMSEHELRAIVIAFIVGALVARFGPRVWRWADRPADD